MTKFANAHLNNETTRKKVAVVRDDYRATRSSVALRQDLKQHQKLAL